MRGRWAWLAALVVWAGCDGEAALGERCTTSGKQSNCVDGAICTAEDDGVKVCRLSCEVQEDCPAETTCEGVSGSGAHSCQP